MLMEKPETNQTLNNEIRKKKIPYVGEREVERNCLN